MKLIVGLGNPGKKYEHTRHNIGFQVVDALATKLGLQFKFDKYANAEVAKSQNVILAKPQTFMNESGKAVRALLNSHSLVAANVLIVRDEIDLPLGKLKTSKTDSGSAGHRGEESIFQSIGSGFDKLRFGIEGRQQYRIPDTETYVLQRFSSEDAETVAKKIPEAVGLILSILELESQS